MSAEHQYEITIRWTGNLGTGTSNYAAYSRNHEIQSPRKWAPILGSSDPKFRGDPTRYNPEELLVATLSACHMLWVLHLCAVRGITVIDYSDDAKGVMVENADGSGEFTEAVLRPEMTIVESDRIADALALHAEAHGMCFIARSVKFAFRCEPTVHVTNRS